MPTKPELPYSRLSVTMPRRRFVLAATVGACGAARPLQAQSSAWPGKPLRLVVGWVAGGAADTIARLVAAKLGAELGQPVLIDNRAGANSNVGAESVARAPADGYTLFLYTISTTINASLYARPGYDPIEDFEPIGMIAKIPNILVVNPRLPVQNLADYVRYARQTPNGVSFASSGKGSSLHMSGELFKRLAGLRMLHVPYRGSALAITDLIGGQVDSIFDNAPSALPHVQAGRLRAVAITSAQRSPLLPDLPTLAESGYPGFEVQSWFALAAPAGTPRPVIGQLNAALNKALAAPDLRQRLQDLGATPEAGTPGQMRGFALAEIERWRELVKSAGITAE